MTKLSSDDDMSKIEVTACDGASSFLCDPYVGHWEFSETVRALESFVAGGPDGSVELRWRELGPDYGLAAFHAAMEFRQLGKIQVAVMARSDRFEFGGREVAAEAKLFFVTEPALFDDFLRGLRALRDGLSDTAELSGLRPFQMAWP
ncbi:MAG TPA: hypothetical protein VFT37_12295 [Telluria sp.]|nr:hypothetical protein [Telluria sp.]